MHRSKSAPHATFRLFLRRLAKKHRYEFGAGKDGKIGVLEREGSPIRIHFVVAGKRGVFVYISLRTTSWNFDGERTDLHDGLSISLACFLRVMEPHISSVLWDEFNPAVAVPEVELYARTLTFAQPWESTYRLDRKGLAGIAALVKAIWFFEIMLPRMTAWSKALAKAPRAKLYEFDNPILRRWTKDVRSALHRSAARHTQAALRRNPLWMYFRAIKPAISVFLNPPLVGGLRALIKTEKQWRTVSTPQAKFFSAGLTESALTRTQWQRATAWIRKLPGEQKDTAVHFIPLENYCVALGDGHLICWAVDCGRQQFRKLREAMRAQHERESAVLFRRSRVTLNARIDDELFEEMITRLLQREPNVHWARKLGHARQPEGGKDIVVEWDLAPPRTTKIPAESAPRIRRKVLVQCKATKHTVGKADVRDIRDLLEHNDASGFLLVASTYLTVGLIEQLIKLRDGGCLLV